MSLIASRIHLVWVATICGKLKTDYRYSNTLGWNTFPLPRLTKKNKEDLTMLTSIIRYVCIQTGWLISSDQIPEKVSRVHKMRVETFDPSKINQEFLNNTSIFSYAITFKNTLKATIS